MNVQSKRRMMLVGVLYNHRAECFSLKWKQLKKEVMNADLILQLVSCFEPRNVSVDVTWTGLSLFTAVPKASPTKVSLSPLARPRDQS